MIQRIAIVFFCIAAVGICVWLLLANSQKYRLEEPTPEKRREWFEAAAKTAMTNIAKELGPEWEDKQVSVTLHRGDSLTTVADELSRQTGLSIVNDHSDVALQFGLGYKGSLKGALTSILMPLGFTIRRESDAIHIYFKKP